MSARILFDPDFPHGAPEGFTRGCHGGACPAAIPCRDVHRRYCGDMTFRTLFNAGWSLEDIQKRDQETAREARRAERAALQTKTRPKRNRLSDRRTAANQARADQQRLIPKDTLTALHAEGLTDRQIGERLGFTRRQVSGARKGAGLPLNPARRGRPQAPETPGLHSSQEVA